MNPLSFRQTSPPTRIGRRVIPCLILKAGLPRGGLTGRFQKPAESSHEGPASLIGTAAPAGVSPAKPGLISPTGGSVASAPKPAAQESIPGAKQLTLDLGSKPSVPTPKPATSGPQMKLPGMSGQQHELPGMGQVVSPSAPKPGGAGLITPGPSPRPSARVTPASAVGASARTPAEHLAAQSALRPPASKPQAQYGAPMSQLARPAGVRQQVSAAGHYQQMADMHRDLHERTGDPKHLEAAESYGRAAEEHQQRESGLRSGKIKPQAQGVLPQVAVHQQAMRSGAGTQMQLPGGDVMHRRSGKEPKPVMQTAGDVAIQEHKANIERHNQTAAIHDYLFDKTGNQAHKNFADHHRQAAAGLTDHASKISSGEVSPTQRTSVHDASDEAHSLSASTLSTLPRTNAGEVGDIMRTGTPEKRRQAIKEAAAGLRQRAETSGRQQPKEATQPTFKPAKTKFFSGKLKSGQDPHSNMADYHTQMAAHHTHQYQQSGDQKHLSAAEAHKMAAGSHRSTSSLKPEERGQEHVAGAYGRSENAEKLSQAAGVKGGYGQRLDLARRSQAFGAKFGHDRPLAAGDGEAGPAARGGGSRGGGGRGDGSQQFTGGAGSRGGRTQGRGIAGRTPAVSRVGGVAGPNIAGNYYQGYGLGLLAGQIGGPAAQMGQITGRAMGKLHGLAQARKRPSQQAQDNRTAEMQRQQQLDQLYRVANK